MPIPILFLLGYSAVVCTYEVAKTSKSSASSRNVRYISKGARIKK